MAKGDAAHAQNPVIGSRRPPAVPADPPIVEIVVLTMLAWTNAACTSRRSPVRPSRVVANAWRSACADRPWIPAAENQFANRRCACRIETR